MSRWKETIGKGFGTGRKAGQSRKHPVTDERDGSNGGFHTEHWDGRQDATVNIKPINARSLVQGDEDS